MTTININDIKRVGIIGAGTMGQGIAQVVAMAGYNVVLYDIQKDVLEEAVKNIESSLNKGIEKGKVAEVQKQTVLKNISTTAILADVEADLVVEAIVEDLAVKQHVLRELEEINDNLTVFASNTSSIPITRIGAALKHPERFLGMHFFNPAHIMTLVEIISGEATQPEVAAVAKDFAETLKKVAVLANDSPGFIVNRVARHFYTEGLKILEEGVADVESIDDLMRASGFRLGPFQLIDLIGVDTNLSVTTSMYNSFFQDPKFRPSRIQRQKVDAGYLGRKSGKGFYKYER